MAVKAQQIVAALAVMALIGVGYLFIASSRQKLEDVQRQSLPQTIQEPVKTIVGNSGCPTWKGHLPEESALDKLDLTKLRELYHTYTTNIEVVCKQMLRMGNLGDGGWEICIDDYVRPPTSCLIYSFGIANDFSFDDMAGQRFGCEIHSFDPSMTMNDTKRSNQVMFHHLGVYGTNGVINKNWPVKTIKEIKNTLGHADRKIDVLKMDVESSEWSTLPTSLMDGSLKTATQFLLETHSGDDKPRYISQLKLLIKIRKLGFRIFYAHKNPACPLGGNSYNPRKTICHEIHMIRIPACEGV